MAGPPVYEDEFFEFSIDPSYYSLDNTFKLCVQDYRTRLHWAKSLGLDKSEFVLHKKSLLQFCTYCVVSFGLKFDLRIGKQAMETV